MLLTFEACNEAGRLGIPGIILLITLFLIEVSVDAY